MQIAKMQNLLILLPVIPYKEKSARKQDMKRSTRHIGCSFRYGLNSLNPKSVIRDLFHSIPFSNDRH